MATTRANTSERGVPGRSPGSLRAYTMDTPGPVGVNDRGSAVTRPAARAGVPATNRESVLAAVCDGEPVIYEYGNVLPTGGYGLTRPTKKKSGEFYRVGDVWHEYSVGKGWMFDYLRPRNLDLYVTVVGDYSKVEEDLRGLVGMQTEYSIVERISLIDRPNKGLDSPSGKFEVLLRLGEKDDPEVLYVPLFERRFAGRSRGGIMHGNSLHDYYWHNRAVDSTRFALFCSELGLSLTLDLTTGVATGIVKATGRRVLVAVARQSGPAAARYLARKLILLGMKKSAANAVKAFPTFLKELTRQHSRQQLVSALDTQRGTTDAAWKVWGPALTLATTAFLQKWLELMILSDSQIALIIKSMGANATSTTGRIAAFVAEPLAKELFKAVTVGFAALGTAGAKSINSPQDFESLLTRTTREEIADRAMNALLAVPKAAWNQVLNSLATVVTKQ